MSTQKLQLQQHETYASFGRSAEAEVVDTLSGLARHHRLSVAEVAGKLERGLWSRDACLGSLRMQLAFERLCEEDGFSA